MFVKIQLLNQLGESKRLTEVKDACFVTDKFLMTKSESLCSGANEPQLLIPHATTTEACTPRARAPQQEKPPQGEAYAPQ